jgi:hypothetical protein
MTNVNDSVTHIGQSELAVARLSLGAAVDDPAANAAAICPHVRSFLAAFGATPELHVLGLDPQIVPHLERLDRAHARAQRRMAASRIPDRDPREMAPEEDIAIGRLRI